MDTNKNINTIVIYDEDCCGKDNIQFSEVIEELLCEALLRNQTYYWICLFLWFHHKTVTM